MKKRSIVAEGDLLLVEVTASHDVTEVRTYHQVRTYWCQARWRYVRVARAVSEGDELIAVYVPSLELMARTYIPRRYMLPEEKSREEVLVRSVRLLSSWMLQNFGHAKCDRSFSCLCHLLS